MPMWVLISLKRMLLSLLKLLLLFIVSLKIYSMILNKHYWRLLTSTKSIRISSTIRLSTLDEVRYLLNRTLSYLGMNNRWEIVLFDLGLEFRIRIRLSVPTIDHLGARKGRREGYTSNLTPVSYTHLTLPTKRIV